MKKSTRIRPVVESLESMLLLSTATMDLQSHHAPIVAPHVSTEATTAVHLMGTLKGTGTVNFAAASATASGSGNLGKVGKASFKVSGAEASLPTTVTLKTSKGNLILSSASPIVGSGSGASTTYSIVGGTKSYAHATGSGTVSGSYTAPNSAGKFHLTVKFS